MTNEEVISTYKAQSQAAEEELLRLQTERDGKVKAIYDHSVHLYDCAWKEYYERRNEIQSRIKNAMSKLKIYVETSDDDAETKCSIIDERHRELALLQTELDEVKASYRMRSRNISDSRKADIDAVRRQYECRIIDQNAIIRALRDAYLKRIRY